MEILKSGRNKKRFIIKCYRCDCVFKASRDEMDTDYTREYETVYDVDCPECNTTNTQRDSDFNKSNQSELAEDNDIDSYEYEGY